MFDQNELARNLRGARARADMTQEELAQAAGISSASLIAYENGKTVPLVSTLYDLACVLSVSPNDLLGYVSN